MSLTETTNVYADPSSWLPLEGLAPGFDANKAETTAVLDGKHFRLNNADGTAVLFTFDGGLVTIDGGPASQPCEIFHVAEGLYYAQFQKAEQPDTAVSVVLDLSHGRALTITSSIDGAAPGRTAVGQAFVPATIDGMVVSGSEPAPSSSLVGRRVMWTYSQEHAYEHIYLTPELYTWHCLAGPERGLADTDQNTVWQLRPGIYVFAWREKVIPCASVTIADHRDITALRSHGVLFGTGNDGTGTTHFTFGAFGRLLSQTVHP